MVKTLVGTVAHFFGNISVASLKMSGDLKVGDRISIENKDGTIVIQETVTSMQIKPAQVPSAKAGDDVTIKTSGKVHSGNLVYKITE